MKSINLRVVRINFDTQAFVKITKDRAAKHVEILSAVGRTILWDF